MTRIHVLMLVVSLLVVACNGETRTDPCEGNTCSGHGTCDSSSGTAVCACDEGWVGDLCAECGEGYHDEGGECVVDEVCEAESCSGHGTCVNSTGVVVCDCDEGYEGSRCEACALGYQDNDGNGTCEQNCILAGFNCVNGYCDDSSGTAVCLCQTGYTGAVCDTCDAGYQDNDSNDTCLPDCVSAGLNCGYHGTCDDTSGMAACSCETGYAGAACDTCDVGYQDNDGNGICEQNCYAAGLNCVHGYCDDSSGTAICACDTGYQDNDRDGSCLPDCSDQDCSGHGTCDDSGGAAVCACDVGYAEAECETCAAGYQDNDVNGTCLADCATSGLDCGSYGDCDDSSGAVVCSCNPGYTGAACDACDTGYQDNDGDGTCLADCATSGLACGLHGTCDDSGGAAVCACDVGYAGALCDTCDVGHQDNDGDGICQPDCATSGLDCGIHGACNDSGGTAVCVCDAEYTGVECDTCVAGYQDNDGNGTCMPDCSTQDCNGHGTCDDSGGTAVCGCDVGYVGAECDTCEVGYQDNDGNGTCLPDCSAQDCSGHGTCDDLSGEAVCTCDDGWGGAGCYVEVVGIEWVAIPGGTFMMGSDVYDWEQPVHQVDVPAFVMTMTEVTVAQYRTCVDAGACTSPDQGGWYDNWGAAGREDHPVNSVDWFQAVDFCTWVGGRLPSEAEWEYAARGGGQDITYPWGEDSPSCTYAVMDDGGWGCGLDLTWVVCSKTAGNTAQGLCDMAGNVWEWVQDWYHSDYNGAPSDGSAWETPSGSSRVVRGGSFGNVADFLRASYRFDVDPSVRAGGLGLRCAR